MKCAGVAVFTVGLYTTVKWLSGKKITFSSEEKDENDLDFIERIKNEYG
jgi:hypothetical protein